MKNSFKMGALALVIAVSFAACKGKATTGTSDSDSTKKADSAKVVVDTAKKADTAKAKVDTAKAAKKDTTKKK